MNITNFMHLVPEIEKKIVDENIDTLVMGLGPTAYLVPWIDSKILRKLRLWGCHDVGRIIRVHDLVLMDSPLAMLTQTQVSRLRPGTDAHDFVVNARPDRVWVFKPNLREWIPYLHKPVLSVVRAEDMFVWQRKGTQGLPDRPKKVDISSQIPHTIHISPTGVTTLAWREGCRRIGVIGVDMRKYEHHTFNKSEDVDRFMLDCAKQAHDQGGCIVNLSPITSLEKFAAWKPSTSGSAPSSVNETTTQSSS